MLDTFAWRDWVAVVGRSVAQHGSGGQARGCDQVGGTHGTSFGLTGDLSGQLFDVRCVGVQPNQQATNTSSLRFPINKLACPTISDFLSHLQLERSSAGARRCQ